MIYYVKTTSGGFHINLNHIVMISDVSESAYDTLKFTIICHSVPYRLEFEYWNNSEMAGQEHDDLLNAWRKQEK